MSVTRKCAAAIRRAIKAGDGNAEISRRVGVQVLTVRHFREGRKSGRTKIRKGSGGPLHRARRGAQRFI